jgi:predicted N-acetyltransferase YhbS
MHVLDRVQFRLATPQEQSTIAALVNRVFQPPANTMNEMFPLLLHANNRNVVAVKDTQIVGCVGIYPETLVVAGEYYDGVRIGAVCVDPLASGQGIGSAMFQYTRDYLRRAGAAFMLISGTKALYMQNGAELFGDFEQFDIATVDPASSTLRVNRLAKTPETLMKLQRAYRLKSPRFDRTMIDLEFQLQAEALPQLNAGRLVSLEGCLDEKVGYVVISQSDLQALVVEYSGDFNTVLAIVQAYSQVHDGKAVRVVLPASSPECVKLRARFDSKQIQNAGAVVYYDDALRNVAFPYTWDLGFI